MTMTTISHLTCEYRTNPLGIDVPRPRLSWQMQSDRRGAHQTAYQILVASSETGLDGSDGREGGTSKELIGTAFFAYSSGLLANIARILDREEDALRYDALSDEARRAFIKRFVHEDGTIEGGTQTSYVLALEFDLLPKELRPMAAAELVRNIQEREYHLSSGCMQSLVGLILINLAISALSCIRILGVD
jgi:hypothetical protein